MFVHDIMVSEVVTCAPESTAQAIALAMWDHNCGCIPIVDEDYHPTGVVTDRDITITAALRHCPLWEITAREISDGQTVICCREDDEIHRALEAMQRHSIRRLPVVDEDGRLTGIVALGDIFAVAGTRRGARLRFDDTLSTLQSVSAHHLGSKQTPPARVV
jgi:CBS domain-containing protein